MVTGGYKQERPELGSRKILNPGSRWDQLNSYCRKEYFQEYKWARRCLIFACLSCKTPNWVGLFCVTECLVTIMADNWLCGIITSSQALHRILISSPTSPSLIWRLPRLISRQNICPLLGVFEVLSSLRLIFRQIKSVSQRGPCWCLSNCLPANCYWNGLFFSLIWANIGM